MSAVELTWLGQSGFVLRGAAGTVAIDPFLSPGELRLYPPPSPGLLPERVDAYLSTHLHGDHFDEPALARLAAAGPIRVVVPAGVRAHAAAALGATAECIGIAAGETLEIAGIPVAAVAVVHGDEPSDAYREGDYLGYLVELDGVRVFHSGDALVSAHLVERLVALAPDVVLLPINGRDWYREQAGFVGNMDAAEAVALAEQVGAQVLIPTHYDAIRGNTADPGEVVTRARAREGSRLHVLAPARGVPIALALSPRAELDG